MNRRIPAPSPASTWRARFLEIARQSEGDLGQAAGRPSELRSRARMAGFATIRLGRRNPAGPRLG